MVFINDYYGNYIKSIDIILTYLHKIRLAQLGFEPRYMTMKTSCLNHLTIEPFIRSAFNGLTLFFTII